MNHIFSRFALVLSIALTTQFAFAQVTDTLDASGGGGSNCVTLTAPMSLGSKDSRTNGQVSDLQQFLQDSGYLYPDPTGYFGAQTKKAVQKFQTANNITANGLVGPYTRAVIKQVSCNGTTSTPNPTNPTVPPVPTQVSTASLKLSLDYSSGNESSLNAYSSVNVLAGSSLNVSKTGTNYDSSNNIGMFWVNLLKSNGDPANVYVGDYTITTTNQNLIDNGSYWTVPAGQTALFKIKKSYNPKNLFAGSYHFSTGFSRAGESVSVYGNNISNSVTVAGETSPYISSVSASDTGYVIQGVRFDPTSNSVSINGVTKTLPSSNTYAPSAYGQSSITVGSVIRFNPSDFGITSSGTYTIQVATNNGASNFYGAIIGNSQTVTTVASPKIEFIGTPTLALSIGGNESVLVGKATVKITTGGQSINVSQTPFGSVLQFNNGAGTAVNTNNTKYQAVTSSGSTVTTIPQNTSITFSITDTVPVRELFAGTYILKPATFGYIDQNGYKYIQSTDYKNAAPSNSVTVIGETSPYISSTSYENGQVILRGARLNISGNNVMMDGNRSIGFGMSTDGTQVSFSALGNNISAGTHTFTVFNNNVGNSNTAAVTVTSLTTSGSAPVISMTADGMTVRDGDTLSVTSTDGSMHLVWGGSGATSCTLNGTAVPSTGDQTFNNLNSTAYTYTCSNSYGSKILRFNVNVPATGTAPTVSMTANGSPITNGSTITATGGNLALTWSSTPNNPSCSLNNTAIPASGSQSFTGLTSNSYTYACTNNYGSASLSFKVSVPAATVSATVPSISMNVNGSPLANGGSFQATNGSAYISWSSTGATSCTLNGNSLSSTSSAQTFNNLTNGTSVVACTNSKGTNTFTFTAIVPAAGVVPSVSMTANGSPVTEGSTINGSVGLVDLQWSSTNASSCTLNGAQIPSVGTKLYTTAELASASYTYTCTNGSGSASLHFSVSVVTIPTASLQLSASSVDVNSAFTANWSGTNVPTGYSLMVDGTVPVPNTTTTTWSGTPASLGLGVGQHTISIKACNSGGCSGWAQQTLTVTTAPKAPTAYINFISSSLVSTNSEFTISWSGSGSPTGYKLKLDNGNPLDVGTRTYWSVTPATLGLSAGQYSIYAQGCNSVGCGEWSAPVVLTVTAPISLNLNSTSFVLGASTACVDLPYNLHRGNESYAVTKLQEFLKSRNFLEETTGFYGDKTVSAVEKYQEVNNLPMTGMVYDFTRQAIKAETCQ